MSTVFHIVIPARYASTRLPAKPLRDIGGKPMIQWVHQQALAAGAQSVTVATDDSRIRDAVRGFGGEVVMTSPDHPSGTDRLEEVTRLLGFDDDTLLVNVQGDEPLIPPAVIRQVAANLAANPDAAVATLWEPILAAADFDNPNIVKVVTDRAGMALYFSRAPIPWPRDHRLAGAPGLPEELDARRHLGIYAYRVRELRDFVTWPVAPLERLECLEQLRFLWQGRRIHLAEACAPVPGGVDTEADLARVIDMLGGAAP
ncbi:MAG: 3-deoxy-manno-octulosonate cytidylyltransferase [Pseudomonadota bacterium]|nr:3-deoxy-manno-octulosonate cytidylyltransferase [Pseudomonadota bacterium]